MRGVKAPVSQGEPVRRRLMEKGVIDPQYRIYVSGGHIYFPTTEPVEGLENGDFPFDEREQRPTFEDALKTIVPPDVADSLHTFDSIGDIAIFDDQEELHPYEREIGEAFLATQKHFKTVLAKTGALEGDFRTRPYRLLAGEDTTETLHKEHGLYFYLDLSKVFFSPRLATERRRVASLVGDGEVVVDMFCGVGPFSLCICKYAAPRKVYAIDLNPDAIRYLEKNIAKNGAEGCIEPICGDAREVIRGLECADRILMNLPKYAHEFLSDAMAAAKDGTVIHYYTIVESGKEEEHEAFIGEKAREKGKEATILQRITVKPYSPHTYMTAYDIKLTSIVPLSSSGL
jgi:tRNA (guanine37-N1)-methyltransferase